MGNKVTLDLELDSHQLNTAVQKYISQMISTSEMRDRIERYGTQRVQSIVKDYIQSGRFINTFKEIAAQSLATQITNEIKKEVINSIDLESVKQMIIDKVTSEVSKNLIKKLNQ